MKPRHLERIVWSPNPVRPPDLGGWPFTIPAVAEMIADGGLEISPGITFLVGENGSGKSTLDEVGVYFLDEPEAALSFHSCLGLVSLLDTMRREGSQVLVATHAPLLVSLPGATLLQLGEHGIAKVESYDELALVKDWRAFLAGPRRYLRHLVEAEE